MRKLLISKQAVRLRRLGNFPISLIQKVNHLLGPAVPDLLITTLEDKHQLQQVMRIAQVYRPSRFL